MKNKYIILLNLLIGFNLKCQYKHIITFFIRPYPIFQDVKDLGDTITQPGKMETQILKKDLKHKINSGIFAMYGGFLAVSDLNGQIIFPRLAQKPKLNLLVVNKIKPVKKDSNIIDYWSIDDNASFYSIERDQDAKTKLYYWNVEKQELKSNKIPLGTIIILAKPKNIIVPEGITLATPNPQLFLPNIYAKKNIDLSGNALTILNLKRYFEPIRKAYKKEKNIYDLLISNY